MNSSSQQQHNQQHRKPFHLFFPVSSFGFSFASSISTFASCPTTKFKFKMKFTTSTLLSTSAILATSAALTPTSGTSYRLVINSTNPAISGSSLALKDDPTANTSPNALGSWSTGEPREEYTFTFSPNPDNDKLYELKGAVRQTHLILTGNDAAMPLYDVAIGADPTPAGDDKLFTNNFMIYNDNELLHAQRWGVTHNASDMVGSGTWRACKNNTEYDYLVLWYDGKLSYSPRTFAPES